MKIINPRPARSASCHGYRRGNSPHFRILDRTRFPYDPESAFFQIAEVDPRSGSLIRWATSTRYRKIQGAHRGMARLQAELAQRGIASHQFYSPI